MSAQGGDEDVDARFNEIIAGIADGMEWDTTGTDEGADPAKPTMAGPTKDTEAEAAARERRRAIRRAERAAEYAEFQVEKAVEASTAEDEAAIEGSDAHFVPPEPPPLPKPKRRTVVAMIALGLGLLLFAWPGLLQVDSDLARILGVVFLIGGFALLVAGLRNSPSDPDSPDWDNGARL